MENLNLYGFLVRPGRWNVATCDDSIVIRSVSLEVMLFYIMTRDIFGVTSFYIWMFAPAYEISLLFIL